VGGTWYYPSDDRTYDEVGVASWYGPGFHGKSTANGEWYDQDGISAAHKTLPLPSYVEVTNLETGKSMVVRVNDRGPFVGDRIIDLSRQTARLLDVQQKGTARVRVRRVHPSAEQVAQLQPHVPRTPLRVTPPAGAILLAAATPAQAQGQGQAASRAPTRAPAAVAVRPVTPAEQTDPTPAAVQAVAIPASSAHGQPTAGAGLPSAPEPTGAQAAGGAIFIQVAAVSDQGRASWLAGYLQQFGRPTVERTPTGLHRVRLGPYGSVDSALATLAQVRLAGYEEAWVVGAPASVPVS
jgi:rare lipoprotein A